MKSCSITKLRDNVYVIVSDVELSGEELLLTSKGRAVAKVVPLEESGPLKSSFVAEVQRRMKEDASLPAEEAFKKLW